MPATAATESWTTWLFLLAAFALAPFVLTMVTSFVKLVVVASLIRTAIGTPQIPPAIVINGLALVLTIHIMWPVGEAVGVNYARLAAERREQNRLQRPEADPNAADLTSGEAVELALQAASEPLSKFLRKNADPRNVELFQQLRTRLAAGNATPGDVNAPAPESPLAVWTTLVPAFVLTELTEAFQIGFLIFLPFLIIDLAVSNVLLALGAQTLQPTVVSLPLKLLLFVMVDGWSLLVKSVVLGYT